MTVNLEPDQPGPMHRNRDMLNDPTLGHDRVPPTQRLEDPVQRSLAAQVDNDTVGSSDATDSKKYYETVLDRRSASELRVPRANGSSQSYRRAFSLPLGAIDCVLWC